MTRRSVRFNVLLLALIGSIVTPAWGQITAEKVKRSLEQGILYLKAQQNPRLGSWSEQNGYPGGVTALCTLALLNAGVPADDPVIRKALEYLRKPKSPLRTYSVALQTMVLCEADPQQDRLQIRENVKWLQQTQITDGPFNGAWAYGELKRGGDPSNTQFAMLALYAAETIGIDVEESTWRRALGYWTRTQRDNGSWGYNPEMPSTGSMTCAGVASVVIASGQVSETDAKVTGDVVDCCARQSNNNVAQQGLDWLGRNFSVNSNPNSMASRRNRSFSRTWLLYYMYGIERVGRLSGRRFIGRHDWYREGAEALLEQQDKLQGYWRGTGMEANTHIGTALAVLFLAKGRRPVVIAKLRREPEADWNRHRHDLAHLTRDIERRWERDLSWQIIEGSAATVEDLLETPILYLSGRDSLQFSRQQKETLRQYIDQGGFIFAEACCEGNGFDRDFRDLIAELFPDNPLRLLPADHPIWYAEEKVAPDYMRPLYGVDSCCRTSIIYCPGELSCYWELADSRQQSTYPPVVQEEIKAALAIGANVITYATNRELKEKLDTPPVLAIEGDQGVHDRGTLYIAKVGHNGGSDDAPAALANLQRLLGGKLNLRVSSEKRLLPLTDTSLSEYPIAFMHGRRSFRLTAAERSALVDFVKNGGFIFADSICASQQFTDSFRREMKAAFPDHPLQAIPVDHPLFTDKFQGFDLRKVQLRDPKQRRTDDQPLRSRVESVAPELQGIELDGRLAVVFSPYDLSCALENQGSIECKGYMREDAAKIGINVILYAMQN
ncbi:MAG: DUF4159 domain-containing protein [Planctomycetaceae bacterium]|nr:DUF4159 domain-containing protein [Planctomycetaceae bacterium]